MKFFMEQLMNKIRVPDRKNDTYEESTRYTGELPDVKRVLVLAAHPDDETLGCGGTILLHKKAGAEVRVIMLTDGSRVNVNADDVKGIRRTEAGEAANILGIDKVFFFDIPDMELKDRSNMKRARERVFELVHDFNPELVYAPSPLDFHPDHYSAFYLAYDILKYGIPVAFYEVYAPVRFNTLINITDVIQVKEKAMEAYKYSLLGVPAHFIHAMRGLNSYRGFFEGYDGNERLYEAFWTLGSPLKKSEIIKWLTYDL
jgi:LmbE family N-acetylglucosaminyl deacetylase